MMIWPSGAQPGRSSHRPVAAGDVDGVVVARSLPHVLQGQRPGQFGLDRVDVAAQAGGLGLVAAVCLRAGLSGTNLNLTVETLDASDGSLWIRTERSSCR